MTTVRVSGDVEPGFEAVADGFRAGFKERGELGAAFSAYVGSRKVVDVWGGTADPTTGSPWVEETLQLIFSGTKGLTAGSVLLLLDDGLLELDRPVAAYWPEFATEGKEVISVGELLSHQGGLAAVTSPLAQDDALDPTRMAHLLSEQAPYWPDGHRLAYHALTYGWLCDALVRQVCGQSVGQLFRSRIGEALDIEAWIGLPPAQEARVSRLIIDERVVSPPIRYSDYGRLIYGNPPTFDEPLPWNRVEFHAAEVAAINGIATARAMAKFYSCLANGGALDGSRVWSPEAAALGQRELARGQDPFFDEPLAFGIGFQLQTDLMHLGPVAGAFGHGGAGGSLHGAWPEAGVGFSYCMNLMRDDTVDDRGRRLLDALARSVSARSHSETLHRPAF